MPLPSDSRTLNVISNTEDILPSDSKYQILSPTLKIYCPQTVKRQILSPTLKIYCPQTVKRQMLSNTLRILFCPKTKYNHALPLKKKSTLSLLYFPASVLSCSFCCLFSFLYDFLSIFFLSILLNVLQVYCSWLHPLSILEEPRSATIVKVNQ